MKNPFDILRQIGYNLYVPSSVLLKEAIHLKEEQENQEENAEQRGDRTANFLGEIPESWKRRARAAFGYTFCVTILLAVSCEIAVAIFPTVQWLVAAAKVLRNVGYHLYYYGVGLGVGIVAPCLAWEHIMYLREKHRREQAEAFAAAVNAALQREREMAQRAREQAEAANAQLQEQITALETEVTHLRRELNGANARSQPSDNEDG